MAAAPRVHCSGMWKLRVVSSRLLMLVVVVIIAIILITMMTHFMTSQLNYDDTDLDLRQHRGFFRHDTNHDTLSSSLPHPLLDTGQALAGATESWGPVKIPGSEVWILSAVLRADLFKNTSNGQPGPRIMLQGWKVRDYPLDQFVCCIRQSDWPDSKYSVQVSAAVYPPSSNSFRVHPVSSTPQFNGHQIPGDLSKAQLPYVDVQYWCPAENDSVTAGHVLHTVALALTSCQTDLSQDLTVHLPDPPTKRENLLFHEFINQTKDGSTNILADQTANKVSDGRTHTTFDMFVKETGSGNNRSTLVGDDSKKQIEDNRLNVQTSSISFDREKLSSSIRIAVCAGVMDFGSVSQVEQVVEWFEHLRLLAVERVQLFYHSASEAVLAVLDFYRAQGFLNALQWKILAPIQAHSRKGNYSWVDENVAYNDCLQRLSAYTVLVFTSLYQLIVPKDDKITLLTATQGALQENPKTGMITVRTHLMPPCHPDEAERGHDGLALIPSLHCPASAITTSLTWLLLPARVDRISQGHVVLHKGVDRIKFPATTMESVSYTRQETGGSNFTTKPDRALISLRSRVLQKTQCLSLPYKLAANAAEILAKMRLCFGQTTR